ncbi:phosphoribosylformylglycinamidine synthase subunit PurQ [Hymenobacter sp. BRD67]|nr:phosphoribosylformylglycinamidine synthase subunit PurQ [Hymenobacter sp. BRD67]
MADLARVPKALILTGFGINCEEEMAAAYRLAGARPPSCTSTRCYTAG